MTGSLDAKIQSLVSSQLTNSHRIEHQIKDEIKTLLHGLRQKEFQQLDDQVASLRKKMTEMEMSSNSNLLAQSTLIQEIKNDSMQCQESLEKHLNHRHIKHLKEELDGKISDTESKLLMIKDGLDERLDQ